MTCAKKIVRCKITTPSGLVFLGENSCDNPQKACPRLPGEGYEKCRSICNQDAHAEVAAIKSALGTDLSGSTAELTGICYSCKPCATQLKKAGVKILKIYM